MVDTVFDPNAEPPIPGLQSIMPYGGNLISPLDLVPGNTGETHSEMASRTAEYGPLSAAQQRHRAGAGVTAQDTGVTSDANGQVGPPGSSGAAEPVDAAIKYFTNGRLTDLFAKNEQANTDAAAVSIAGSKAINEILGQTKANSTAFGNTANNIYADVNDAHQKLVRADSNVLAPILGLIDKDWNKKTQKDRITADSSALQQAQTAFEITRQDLASRGSAVQTQVQMAQNRAENARGALSGLTSAISSALTVDTKLKADQQRDLFAVGQPKLAEAIQASAPGQDVKIGGKSYKYSDVVEAYTSRQTSDFNIEKLANESATGKFALDETANKAREAFAINVAKQMPASTVFDLVNSADKDGNLALTDSVSGRSVKYNAHAFMDLAMQHNETVKSAQNSFAETAAAANQIGAQLSTGTSHTALALTAAPNASNAPMAVAAMNTANDLTRQLQVIYTKQQQGLPLSVDDQMIVRDPNNLLKLKGIAANLKTQNDALDETAKLGMSKEQTALYDQFVNNGGRVNDSNTSTNYMASTIMGPNTFIGRYQRLNPLLDNAKETLSKQFFGIGKSAFGSDAQGQTLNLADLQSLLKFQGNTNDAKFLSIDDSVRKQYQGGMKGAFIALTEDDHLRTAAKSYIDMRNDLIKKVGGDPTTVHGSPLAQYMDGSGNWTPEFYSIMESKNLGVEGTIRYFLNKADVEDIANGKKTVNDSEYDKFAQYVMNGLHDGTRAVRGPQNMNESAYFKAFMDNKENEVIGNVIQQSIRDNPVQLVKQIKAFQDAANGVSTNEGVAALDSAGAVVQSQVVPQNIAARNKLLGALK